MTLVYGSVCHAQQAYPMLMSVDPIAAQTGTTSEHIVKSRYTMEAAYKVLISGSGVTGEVVLPEAKAGEKKKSPLQELTVRFTVAPDAVTGVRDYRIATPNGISTVGQLVIVRDPVAVESAGNDTQLTATEIALPATICGRIEKAEDVDFYKFHVEANETYIFHVRCMRLQDRIHDLQQHADPILSIRNSSGTTLAASDNEFAADPFLTHTFKEAGEHFLEIRDVRYKGNQYWSYSIEVNQRSFVRTAFPLAINTGTPVTLELVGTGLSSDSVGQVFQQEEKTGIHRLLTSYSESDRVPVELVLVDEPTLQESTNENNTIETAQPIQVPCGLNGRIERKADIDCYLFEAKKGERYTFEVTARRAGSSLDSHLRILNDKGGQQQLNDDSRIGKRTFADSILENWTVPADGKYSIEIRDVHLRGGPSFVYFLNVTQSEPHFTLFADTDKTPLTPGTSGVVYVRAEKKNGFDGEIQLHVDGLPEGVTAECGRILTGKPQDGCIVLTAAPDAQLVAQPIQIFGTATIGEDDQKRELITDATIYQEVYQPGGGRGHWPVDSHVVSVGTPGDVRKVTLSTHELRLKPGDTTSIDVEIERAEGFDKNITLEVTYKHLNSVYGNPLPDGVTVDKGASKLLLTGGATKGKITLTASEDAQLTENQVFTVMANVSLNFVMKATYASDPVRITIEK